MDRNPFLNNQSNSIMSKSDLMKTLLVITFLFTVTYLSGQSVTMNHLFSDKRKDLILFMNPTFQFTQYANKYACVPGIRAGIILNKKYIIGGFYNSAITGIVFPAAPDSGNLRVTSGGLHLEYTLWPRRKVHLTVPLSVGMGKPELKENTAATPAGNPHFYFAEPGLMVEMNIWKYAKFGIGGSYRYTKKGLYTSLTQNDLNGFAAVASVKFGMFDYKRQE